MGLFKFNVLNFVSHVATILEMKMEKKMIQKISTFTIMYIQLLLLMRHRICNGINTGYAFFYCSLWVSKD